MLFAALIFVPHLGAFFVFSPRQAYHSGYCICVAFIVISINVGVVGLLALWHVNLDIISVITVLLSIGAYEAKVKHLHPFLLQASPWTSAVTWSTTTIMHRLPTVCIRVCRQHSRL